MVDLALCSNHACPSREKCFRYMAKPDPLWQAYATFYPPKGRRKCDHFITTRKPK
jgi:hypothetical protein